MIFNRKVEIIYSKKSQVILDGQSKICNWLYNHLLDKVIQDYETNKNESTLLVGRNLRNQVPIIKNERKYLYSVHSSPLKNVALLEIDTVIALGKMMVFNKEISTKGTYE